MRRRRRIPPFILPIVFFFVIGVILFGFASLLFSTEQQPISIVEEFYAFEADGNFSESWELLHPFMKEKFSKTAYMQDRTHVFIGHFGAETFTYTIGEELEVEGWKMEEGREPFDTAFKYLVTQQYKGKYGKFNFQQEVYVVKNEDEDQWQILWDFNQ
jgi:hypothetical protein